MNENINLCEILKDCPKGTEFYSPLFGKVSFQTVDNSISVRTVLNDTVYFLPDGSFSILGMASPEVMLFPSSSHRDWSKWECPKPKFDPKTLQPFDKVLAFCGGIWICDFFSHIGEDDIISVISTGRRIRVIPYDDETKHLVGTSDEAPDFYRYWED